MRTIYDNNQTDRTYVRVFNNNAFVQERLIARFFGSQYEKKVLHIWSSLEGSFESPVAIYALDKNAKAVVDLTDYIRTYYGMGDSGTIYMSQVLDDVELTAYGQINIPFVYYGLIDPSHVLIPPHDTLNGGGLIVPPDTIIIKGNQDDDEVCELYGTSGTWNVSGAASISQNKRFIGQINGTFTLTDGTKSKVYTPRTMECGIRYALVRWVSFTGQERDAWLEVAKATSASADNYQLATMDTGYNEAKGRVDSFTLRLAGLTAYDLWYYADILMSSKVEVYVLGEWQRVQVTDKSITMPDGEAGQDGKLEIKLNYAHYDAVAL